MGRVLKYFILKSTEMVYNSRSNEVGPCVYVDQCYTNIINVSLLKVHTELSYEKLIATMPTTLNSLILCHFYVIFMSGRLNNISHKIYIKRQTWMETSYLAPVFGTL